MVGLGVLLSGLILRSVLAGPPTLRADERSPPWPRGASSRRTVVMSGAAVPDGELVAGNGVVEPAQRETKGRRRGAWPHRTAGGEEVGQFRSRQCRACAAGQRQRRPQRSRGGRGGTGRSQTYMRVTLAASPRRHRRRESPTPRPPRPAPTLSSGVPFAQRTAGQRWGGDR